MEEKNDQNLFEVKEESSEPSEAEVRDAEDSVVDEPTPEQIERKKRRDWKIELALVFILGVLAGIAIKSEAVKRITIGYDDYKMKISAQDYNINELQADFLKRQTEAANDQEEEAGSVNGGE